MVGMIESTRQSNAGTGLLGDNYSRRNRPTPTEDGDGGREGRWIAIDESGYDGDQLHGRGRYMTLGSVVVDDTEAASLVGTLRQHARIQESAPELKFQKMFTGTGGVHRRQLLAELLGPGGPLAGRASVYVIDKHYFVASKLVDLLLEEQCHAMGIDIVSNGLARQFARDLAAEGPRALGRDGFDRLLATAVGFFSKKNRNGDQMSVDDFYTVLRESCAYARRRKAPQAKKATDVLEMLRTTRSEAEAFARDRPTEPRPAASDGLLDDSLDPLVTGVPTVIHNASVRYGGKLHALADDQRLLTDDKLDVLERGASAMGVIRGLIREDHLGELVRGRSKDHPSLQLADLVAGAGLAVAKRHDGQDDPAGNDLYPVIVPLIDPNGLLSHEEPERLATVDPLRARAR
jgi:hypothetical protein